MLMIMMNVIVVPVDSLMMMIKVMIMMTIYQ
jgi:hypothetical protein